MKKTRVKAGAASFYIVAFATLLLSIIVMSFAAGIISEMSRTANSDLSQSAYDSALAGIEDAKAAFKNYRSCLEQGYVATPININNPTLSCGEIIYYMEHPDCDMTGHMLARIAKNENKEVMIEEKTATGSSDNKLLQAYTCTKISNILDDYRSTIGASSLSRVVKIRLNNADVNNAKSIRLSWYSDRNGTNYNYKNFTVPKVTFPKLVPANTPTPPTISIQLIQSAQNFKLSDFDMTTGSSTNRGTLFFVPSQDKTGITSHATTPTHIDITSDNRISSSEGFLKSNDKTAENLPFLAACPNDSTKEFACSVSIEIPTPVGGQRNPDTFMFVVSLPYGRPETDFSIELCKDSNCSETSYSNYAAGDPNNDKLQFRDVQVNIDSTGRANDLYRRVDTRLETSNIYFPYPEYVAQLLGDGVTLTKNFSTTTEWNF